MFEPLPIRQSLGERQYAFTLYQFLIEYLAKYIEQFEWLKLSIVCNANILVFFFFLLTKTLERRCAYSKNLTMYQEIVFDPTDRFWSEV